MFATLIVILKVIMVYVRVICFNSFSIFSLSPLSSLWDVLYYWCCCWCRGPNHTGLFIDHSDCREVSSQRYVQCIVVYEEIKCTE